MEHFWRFVDTSCGKDSCWLWTGKIHSESMEWRRGMYKFNGLLLSASRVAYLLENRKQHEDCGHVRHSCGESLCCNPKHLYVRGDPNILVDHFWRKVDIRSTEECWLWSGSISRYGQFRHGNKSYLAHRYAFTSSNGLDYNDPEMVLHLCDNPPCCNPNHLMAGNNSTNMKQAFERGLHRSYFKSQPGASNPNSILDDESVIEILADDRMYKEIAADFGIKECTVASIKQNKSWKHIPRS